MIDLSQRGFGDDISFQQIARRFEIESFIRANSLKRFERCYFFAIGSEIRKLGDNCICKCAVECGLTSNTIPT